MVRPRFSIALLGFLVAGGCANVSRYNDLSVNDDLASGPSDMSLRASDFAMSHDLAMSASTDGAVDLAQQDRGLAPIDMSVPTDGAAPDLSVADGPDVMPDMASMPNMAIARDLAGTDAPPPDLGCAMACNAPPPPACVANNIRTFDKNGTCVNSKCTYTFTDVNCPNGCFNAACTAALSFFGNVTAFRAGSMVKVDLVNGSATAIQGVDVYSETFPQGSAKEVHLLYTIDVNFGMNVKVYDLTAAFSQTVGNNDQWLVTIPGQAAGTHIYWYVRADGYSGNPMYYSNFGNNWDYISR